ncbi:MAG TPA: DUF1572 family protein [Thermoanaerobaculia bacterium]|jgi:hypothetical protein
MSAGASVADEFRAEAVREFHSIRRLAEKALAQVSDEDFFATLGPESNSIAVIVKHIAGNLRSRWTDFLASDGEKPDRRRDNEFELDASDSREGLMAKWEEGWRILFANVEPLTNDDLLREVPIRALPHTVVRAINRQLTHYAGHVSQIVLLAKHWTGEKWQTLSIPRGQSEAVNRKMTGPVDNKGRSA